MNYKIRMYLCVVFVFATTIIGIFALTGTKIQNKNALDEQQVISCMKEDSKRFVVRELDGYVAVFFENNDKVPVTVTDISVNTLRDFDKKILQQGVIVPSKERLLMMLEDLGS